MSTEPLVLADRLSFGTPDGKRLAQDLSFQVHAGDLLVISGSNGSGKSTLLRLLLKQIQPHSGQLLVRVSAGKIAVLPQLQNSEFHLPLTLMDVLEVTLKRRLLREEIIRVGLLDEGHLSLAWNTASGGERKRTLLTRLLLESPSLLMLDEPMNHLDRESKARVETAVYSFLKKGPERGVILVSHDASLNTPETGVTLKHLRLGGSPLEASP